VLATTNCSTSNATDRAAGVSWLRTVENEVLLSAVEALRVAGFLTEDEYQAKRQRLVAAR
jgi:hypothetical protein